MSIEIVNFSSSRLDLTAIKRKACKVLKTLGSAGTVGLFFVSKSRIRGLNRKYRRKDRPTDVLSFEIKEKGYLGDVIISPEIVKRNAKRFGVEYKEEMGRMAIHGILHLLGYDHIKKKDEKRMFQAQDKLLKEIWRR